MSTKDMSNKDLKDAYYERRLRMKQRWYAKHKEDIAKYNQKYYKKNIKPPSRKGSQISSKRSSKRSSRHSGHSRHSRHSKHHSRHSSKSKTPEQIDAELTVMIKRLMLLKEKNKSRISRK